MKIILGNFRLPFGRSDCVAVSPDEVGHDRAKISHLEV